MYKFCGCASFWIHLNPDWRSETPTTLLMLPTLFLFLQKLELQVHKKVLTISALFDILQRMVVDNIIW